MSVIPMLAICIAAAGEVRPDLQVISATAAEPRRLGRRDDVVAGTSRDAISARHPIVKPSVWLARFNVTAAVSVTFSMLATAHAAAGEVRPTRRVSLLAPPSSALSFCAQDGIVVVAAKRSTAPLPPVSVSFPSAMIAYRRRRQ
jgi:hypothetical protein